MRMRLMRAAMAALFVMSVSAPAMAQSAAKSKDTQAPAKQETSTSEKKASPKQTAARNRMKECGAEWQEMKKQGKTKDTTWRKFSSQCLKNKKS